MSSSELCKNKEKYNLPSSKKLISRKFLIWRRYIFFIVPIRPLEDMHMFGKKNKENWKVQTDKGDQGQVRKHDRKLRNV